jgi:hypothetical protein
VSIPGASSLAFEQLLESSSVRSSLSLQPAHEDRAKEHEWARKLGLVAADKSAAVGAALDNLEGPPRPSPAQARGERRAVPGELSWRIPGDPFKGRGAITWSWTEPVAEDRSLSDRAGRSAARPPRTPRATGAGASRPRPWPTPRRPVARRRRPPQRHPSSSRPDARSRLSAKQRRSGTTERPGWAAPSSLKASVGRPGVVRWAAPGRPRLETARAGQKRIEPLEVPVATLDPAGMVPV